MALELFFWALIALADGICNAAIMNDDCRKPLDPGPQGKAEESIVILKYSIAWIPMVFIAIINGMFREFVVARMLSELRAHQLSCVTGVLLFSTYTWLISLKWPLKSHKEAMAVGLVWLVLTVAFEFTFGHYVAHHSWEKLLQDYNVLGGRLWVVVLLAVALLPTIVFRIRSRSI